HPLIRLRLHTSPASFMSYDMLCQQYKPIKDLHDKSKAQKHEKILISKRTCHSDSQTRSAGQAQGV
ncbi:hypothetical protein BGZ79_002326, partial [Entomortierella chlamydospora]